MSFFACLTKLISLCPLSATLRLAEQPSVISCLVFYHFCRLFLSRAKSTNSVRFILFKYLKLLNLTLLSPFGCITATFRTCLQCVTCRVKNVACIMWCRIMSSCRMFLGLYLPTWLCLRDSFHSNRAFTLSTGLDCTKNNKTIINRILSFPAQRKIPLCY